MSDIAAYLVDQLLPAAPYRQFVLTVPWVLRYRLSIDRQLLADSDGCGGGVDAR